MKKKRTEKRRPTDEEMSRAADTKLKRYITKSALEWADRDPEIRSQMIAQTFGYKLPDQAEKKQRELIAYVDELAIQRLKEDPELARIVVDARLRQITEEMGLQIEGEEWQRKPLTMDDLIVQFKKVNEIKELMGIKKPGFWNDITDPQVIIGILQIIRELFPAKPSPAAKGALLLVRVNGVDKLVTREQYEQLKAQGHVECVSDVESGEPISLGEGNDTASEPEIPDKTEEGDEEIGDVNSGK